MTLSDLGAALCAGQGELAGRRDETAVLDELLDRAREGTGGALVLWGEPGIGKSALLRHVHGQAADFHRLSYLATRAESDLPASSNAVSISAKP
ncbi:ATP-binding protein [Amycolatopsis sp. lyj-108]|uniref:ATP-binding protein n=1 Tax=Amycolatopsis sp. lyj-108 TaxID=2789286 RepID=UPI00397B6006